MNTTQPQPTAFAARFPGTCAKGDRIAAGEPIVRNADGRYQHAECSPAAAPAAPAADLTPGMYKAGDEIFKVQKTRDGERIYAKRLVQISGRRLVDATEEVVDFEFEYAPGAVRTLTLENRLPVEDAKALGLRFGRCIVCGRHLKDAFSVQNGIGPVCIKRFNW